ncbi:MAG: hypothetical protein EOM16_09865, partial [Bacteroidia bacterium]|nr:hypothetical protein [Bacteroidia bacterium]
MESDELVIGKKDFSVSFWMKTRLCGLGGRPRTFFSLETMLVHYNRMDSDKDFGFEDVPLLGGVLLSNKDCTKFGSDGFAISILPYQAYFHVNFCTSSKGGFLQPVDDDWHFLVINFDRDGLCSVVCDTHCIGSFDISKHKDVLFKEGRLGIGADVKGNWGFQNGNLEHIEFATRLLGTEEIDVLYYPEAIKKLCSEILDRIPLCSRYAPKGMIDDIKLLVTQSALEKPNKAQFEQLRFALEEMIGSGSPKAVFGMISDIHILKTKPTAASMLRHAIKDLGT